MRPYLDMGSLQMALRCQLRWVVLEKGGPFISYDCVLEEEKTCRENATWRHTHRKDGHVKTEAEVGAMQLQAQHHQGVSASSHRKLGESTALPTPCSDLQPLGV